MKHLSFFLIISLLIACSNEKSNQKKQSDKDSTSIALYTDTVITLYKTRPPDYIGPNLDQDLAEMILTEHFLSKGFYISDPLCSQINTDSDFVMVFDTCYFINLNNSSSTDAIVSYWITPRTSSGNEWQPHKAIISDAGKEYLVSNEDFIPVNFCIDSVSDNNGVIIYAYEYDSGSHKKGKNLRIHLEILFKSKPENY